jgi:predicted MPP superfamily phosphohydrolase
MSLTKNDPAGYRARPLHIALLLTELLGQLPSPFLIPVWLGLAALTGWVWQAPEANLATTAAVVVAVFVAADNVSLELLPRLRRSFGPISPPLLGLAIVRALLTITIGLFWPTQAGLWTAAALQLVILSISTYATWIEPFRIDVTYAELHSPKLGGHTPLRLLHISDLHVERSTPRERKLLTLIEELAPHLIVMTGDYLNLSSVYESQSHAEVRDLLERVCEIARAPVYAITGSPPVDRAEIVPAIFDGLPITWLLDSTDKVQINGHSLLIAGLRCTREHHADGARLQTLLNNGSDHTFTLLLYHSPDLMPVASSLDVDLYLCGHTHGGQIRLPLFGALITSSDFWKRYEMGRYEENGTTLYVSRGLGMEGMGAPRARFLAPPEIILWTLSP